MLKMYHKQAHAGNTPDFWEKNWEASHYEQGVRFCAIDPIRPLFEKYSRPDALMLEGGCGIGNYVTYYTSRGWQVVGLDFAQQTLKKLRLRQENLCLCAGDVSRLPFADETFDIYYSGGVVEHFESGAETSLREARRVLKKDGVLLISVPYQSPLRQVLLPLKRDIWRKVEHPLIDETDNLNGNRFFQYAYRRKEFKNMLAEAGLRVIETKGYSVIWGLYDIPFLNTEKKTSESKQISQEKKKITAVNIEPLVKEHQSSYLKRLIVSEDESIPVAGIIVKFMRWFSANMMMYVCIPD